MRGELSYEGWKLRQRKLECKKKIGNESKQMMTENVRSSRHGNRSQRLSQDHSQAKKKDDLSDIAACLQLDDKGTILILIEWIQSHLMAHIEIRNSK